MASVSRRLQRGGGDTPSSRTRRMRRPVSANGNGAHANGESPPNEDGDMDALDVIDAFGLDYNLGNTVRFLLEKDDGDELTNLQTAQTYLERAIARLESTSA